MTDPLDQIADRWAACEGFLSPRVSTTEEDTDLEYRGRAGKWTLATVFDTDEPTGQAWLQALLNAREDVGVLLAEVRRLRAGADQTAIQPREKPTLGPWKADGGAHPSVWRRFDAAGVQRMCSGYLGWSVHTPEGECFADGPETCGRGRIPADAAARGIWELDTSVPTEYLWRRLPNFCTGHVSGLHLRSPHASGMYECLMCGEVGA